MRCELSGEAGHAPSIKMGATRGSEAQFSRSAWLVWIHCGTCNCSDCLGPHRRGHFRVGREPSSLWLRERATRVRASYSGTSLSHPRKATAKPCPEPEGGAITARIGVIGFGDSGPWKASADDRGSAYLNSLSRRSSSMYITGN